MKNKSKSFRLGGYSVLATAIVIAIAIGVNLVAGAIPTKYTRFDTSSKQLYTLGSSSHSVLSKLKDNIEITWLVKDGEEDASINLLLKEYLKTSDKLSLKKVDPDLNPTLISQYTNTFYPNSLIVTCGERSRFVDYYDIYTIQYDAEQYYLYGTYDVDFTGENAITGAINYVTNISCPKLYTLSGHGEAELSNNIKTAVKQSNVDIESFSLLNSDEVPLAADGILINNPSSDLTDSDVEKLLAYLQKGGSMLLITAPTDDGKVLPNVNKLMEYYGVQAVDGIVIDPSPSNYANNMMYALLPDIVSNTVTVYLKNNNYMVLMPFSQGLVLNTPEDENVVQNKLLKTSNSAYSKLAGYGMKTLEKEDGDIEGPFSLGVAVTRTLNEATGTGTKIIWYSSDSIIDEDTSSIVAGANQTLFMESLNWLCGSDSTGVLIGGKSLADETLTMSGSTSIILGALFVAVIPVCYLIAGIIVWIKRRHR